MLFEGFSNLPELNCHLNRVASFVYVPKILAHVRIHDKDRKVGNHTQEKKSGQIQDSIGLVLKARKPARSFEHGSGPAARPSQSR